MKAVRISFMQMLSFIKHDMMLAAVSMIPLCCGLSFKFGIPVLEGMLTNALGRSAVMAPYYRLFDLFFAMLCPVMFCFVAAMVILEEVDEKIAGYLFITPLGRKGYLMSRLGIPAIAAFGVTAILLPVFKLTQMLYVQILLTAAGGAVQGVITALLIVTLSSNKLEGMAVAKLSSLMTIATAAPYFIKGRMQYLLFAIPSFWVGKGGYEDCILGMLPAFAAAAVWIILLLKKFQRKIS